MMLMVTHPTQRQYIIGVFLVVLAAIGLYGILPQFENFNDSLHVLRTASLWLVVLAALTSLLASVFSGLLYKLLAITNVRLVDSVVVQLTGLLVNRIVPAGVGGIALNYLFLRKRRHSSAQAATIVTVNNVLGSMGHGLLLLCGIGITLLLGNELNAHVPNVSLRGTVIAAILISMIALTVVFFSRLQKKTTKRIKKIIADIFKLYKQRPVIAITALPVSIGMTACNVLSFWLCCQALDISISIITALIIFTMGIIVGIVTPTPGGLGGVEAGLIIGLTNSDVSTQSALSAALLYRLASYWFGLIVGAISLIVLQRRHLV
jgi:uncharacterized protein (TIRG00374 family)